VRKDSRVLGKDEEKPNPFGCIVVNRGRSISTVAALAFFVVIMFILLAIAFAQRATSQEVAAGHAMDWSNAPPFPTLPPWPPRSAPPTPTFPTWPPRPPKPPCPDYPSPPPPPPSPPPPSPPVRVIPMTAQPKPPKPKYVDSLTNPFLTYTNNGRIFIGCGI